MASTKLIIPSEFERICGSDTMSIFWHEDELSFERLQFISGQAQESCQNEKNSLWKTVKINIDKIHSTRFLYNLLIFKLRIIPSQQVYTWILPFLLRYNNKVKQRKQPKYLSFQRFWLSFRLRGFLYSSRFCCLNSQWFSLDSLSTISLKFLTILSPTK